MADTLYDEDFLSRTQEQSRLLLQAKQLRLNATPDLDWRNLAEKIEDLGKSQRRELYSQYKVRLLHLIKWRFQPFSELEKSHEGPTR